jgi:hypothetical protein
MDNLLEMLEENPLTRYIPNQMEVEKICDEYQVGKLVNIDGELGGLLNNDYVWEICHTCAFWIKQQKSH